MGQTVRIGRFEWDIDKEQLNIKKHGLSFLSVIGAFYDFTRVIKYDEKHSQDEYRLLCLGMVNHRVATVRFVYRENRIRIFGAGY
jgi:hypothetical protein